MSELKAKISLDSSQFKKALAEVQKSANKAAKDIGGVGKAAGIAGQYVGAGALALGAVLVGKNAKAFAAVRTASIALGSSVAVVGARIGALAPAFSKGLGAGIKSIGKLGSAIGTSVGAGLNYAYQVTKGVAARIGSALMSIAKTALSVGATIATIGAVVGGVFAMGIKGALEYGATLEHLKARTGAPVKDLAILKQAFEDVGIDAEKVGPSLNKMQKALSGVNDEGKPTKAALGAIGLSIEALRKMSPVEQFKAISKGIAGLKDPADRAAAAMDIFGKSGGELNQLFTNPEAIDHAQKVLGGQADLLAKNSAAFEKVSVALKNIFTKLRGFFVGVASGVIDKLSALADVLDSIDLSGFGKKIGDAISSGINIIVNAFKTGQLSTLIGLTFKAGFATAGDFLIGVIQTSLSILSDGLGLVFSSDFFSAIILGFNGVALKFEAALSQALQSPIGTASAYLSVGFQKAMEVIYKLEPFFATIVSFFAAAIQTAIQKVIALLPESLQPAGFQKKSFAENYAAQKEEFAANTPAPGTFKAQTVDEALAESQSGQKEFQKSVNGLADESLKAAGEAFGRLGSSIADILKKNIGNFKPGDVFHSKETRAELEALAKSLNIPIESVQKAANKISLGEAVEPTEKEEKAKKQPAFHAPELDQFARIGLFSRATAPLGLDIHRQTARNTSRLVQLAEQQLRKSNVAVAA